MKINILLPYKEKFTLDKASSVSITVKNNFKYSSFQKNIRIFGQYVEKPMFKDNFVGIKNSWNILASKNKFLATEMCRIILKEMQSYQMIEVHNRPYLINSINKRIKNRVLTLFFHNDPLQMKGSKTYNERQKLLNSVDKIYCVSSYIKSRFLKGIEDDEGKVIVLHNGIEKTKTNITNKNNYVIYVGRIVKEKGVDLFVNAVEKIYKKHSNWKFKIIGSPRIGEKRFNDNFAKNIIEKFESLGNRTLTTGHISTDEVQNIMKNASVIVIPSVWQEPFGLVAAEAMSNGLAIVASNVGGLPEIIGENGILINNINDIKIAQTLEKLLSNKKIIKKMQKESLSNFKFTANISSKKLDKLRKDLITNF